MFCVDASSSLHATYTTAFSFTTNTLDSNMQVHLVGGKVMEITRDSEFERKFLAATGAEWAPEIVTRRQFIAAVGDGASVLTVPNTHVLYISYNTQNFGHFIGDEIFPRTPCCLLLMQSPRMCSCSVCMLSKHTRVTGTIFTAVGRTSEHAVAKRCTTRSL